MKLNHAIFCGFTLCLAAWVLACEPASDYDDSRNGLKCSGKECKIDNHTLLCSDDGLHIYESVDTSINVGLFSPDIPLGNWDTFNFGIYDYEPSKTIEGTIVKYDYRCRHENGYSCKIIDNSIGCYRQCEIRNGNDMNWCEQYENTNHHLFIQNQCILNPADGKYYSNSKPERTFCSSDRTCDNKNGCMTLLLWTQLITPCIMPHSCK